MKPTLTAAISLLLALQPTADLFGQPSASNSPAAVVVALEGTVDTARGGTVQWSAANIGTALTIGDQLRTGQRSRASIRLSNLSVLRVGELMHYEIEPARATSGAKASLNLKAGSAYFFSRDKPGSMELKTPTVTGAIRGTEFAVTVEPDGRTTLMMIDGEVELTNPLGHVTLNAGDQGVAEAGRAPVKTAVINAVNLVQWNLYYPGILDLAELDLTPAEQATLADSIAAYQRGELLEALKQYPATHAPASAADHVYLGAVLLSVGLVKESETHLAATAAAGGNNATLAAALRKIVATVKFEAWTNQAKPGLATEWMAESYYQQSRGNLAAALDAARKAAEKSPRFGFAWERVAELDFSFGQTAAASAALNTSLACAPRNPQAMVLQGFLLAAQNNIPGAIRRFDEAIAIDSALGNAWLGRGLCRIRQGQAEPGREDLQMAAALEPNRAVLRSYLGKAFTETGDAARAGHELELARKFDPNDPTSWLYSALLHQPQNRLNEAIRDLEKSLELNDNRRVYRSQLLLDQDRAVRSSSLASIYRENGMTDVSLREAARAVTHDYANYSAHLFLANSYDALRDPTRFNLRQETVWFNELLLANLLSPAGVRTLSQNISQQEYSRMFESEQLGLVTTTELRSDGQFREVASQFGAVGPLSWSLDLDAQHNDGVRPNNDLSRIEWYSQLKWQLTERDSLFLLTKYQDYHSGDNFQYFNPGALTLATNFFTSAVTTNTAYRPNFKFDEYQKPIALGAYHREWSPGVHTLALAGRLENDQRFGDRSVPLYVLTQDNLGNLLGVSSTDFDVAYRSRLEIWTGELKQIFQTSRNTLLLGGRYQGGEFTTQNELTNITIFSSFFPVLNQTTVADMQRWSVYAYDTLEVAPSKLWLTAGLSYDDVEYPENFRQIPVSNAEASANRLGPKAAMVWSPCLEATVRAAYSRSLGGVSLDQSYRLEPSQLAGFIQSYRTIIPESVVGSVAAPKFETISMALDLKPAPRTYVGLFGEMLNSDVDRVLGTYGFPDSSGFAFPSSTPQQLHYDEYSASLVVNQLLSTEWALGAAYKFTRSELEQALTDVPLSVFAGAKRFDSSDLHNLKLYALYSHASGFFARAEADCYRQENRARTYDTTGNAINSTLPDDQFCQLNVWLGYRFRRALGDISVGVLNVNNTDYQLNPLNAYSELPRERVVAARLRLRF